MRSRLSLRFLFPLGALILLIVALSGNIYSVPPPGMLIDPFVGAIQNERPAGAMAREMTLGGLRDPVRVVFDEREVPHIFAGNEADLFFAQGYVMASLRLWQMDFISYASAGRLAEIFGSERLGYDRNQRRIGILEAARQSLALMMQDQETRVALTSMTKGINAYIDQLGYRDLPLEYKLLNYRPEAWTELKSVLILKYMANTLSGYDEDFNVTNLMLVLGEARFNQYFRDYYPAMSPIVANGAAPVNPSLAWCTKPAYLDYDFLSSGSVISKSDYNPRLGSNSWAVSGKKTRSGHPILCSDPHLNLSLPAIWLEMQLCAPGINVYGVSIPGTPAVIIGFNRDIAWGVTNGADDVKDWYKLKISSDYGKYELDGQWKNIDRRVEEIRRRGEKPFYDTVYNTVQGPIVSTKSFPGEHPEYLDHAMHWMMARPSNEFLTFILLNKAHNYDDYERALRHYSCPIQNFTFACRDNTIAIDHQGSMPVKWPGQGRFVLDGTTSAHLYQRDIPQDSLPHLRDPACHYVFSANQRPTGSAYGYYYNGNYRENRANRIRELLAADTGIDVAGMEAMQLDNTSYFAEIALPVLLKVVNGEGYTPQEQADLQSLAAWKGSFGRDDTTAGLFYLWWNKVREYTWDEFGQYKFDSKTPGDEVLLDLIQHDTANAYFDKLGTPAKETARDIVRVAFVAAAAEFDKFRKSRDIKWGDHNIVHIDHLLKVGQLGINGLPSGGYSETINAISSRWGPSWRMVVELGDRPVAYGIYPGGQSGNPGSGHYSDFVADWNQGRYYPLHYFLSPAEARAGNSGLWTLHP